MAVAFEVQDLRKTYRGSSTAANDGISISIETGIIFGLLGPNGAGKTTFVRQLAGLLRPSSGTVRLLGEDVVRHPEVVPHFVGYYGQQVLALRAHRFSEVLWITGCLRGLSTRDSRRQAEDLMERFDVTPLRSKVLAKMSGGERRLAALIATFMGDLPVLILDEPTNDLDPRKRQILWDYLHHRNATDGATVIVVSHNLPEVENVAHQAALIDSGHLVAHGTLGELKRSVADKVRVELRLRSQERDISSTLKEYGLAKQVRPGLWMLYLEPNLAASTLQAILDQLGTQAIDDFRLITPTLDDVYLHFTARKEGTQ